MAEDSQTPIIPQAAAVLIISYLVYRFFFTGTSTATATRPQRRHDPARLRQQVEAVTGMFPQFSAAAVEAELIRNGGSIEVATERILTTGYLPEPPAPAQPAAPVSAAPVSAAAPAASRSSRRQEARRPAAAAAGPATPRQSGFSDLITRYGLQARLEEWRAMEAEGVTGTEGKGKAPATREGRMLAHKEKRDQMILQARCRMERMIKEGKA
ncbi:hypothetical protein BZA77DRAFT_44951 [Pyronema omphalodes]|nr:hypothetical protein BZA77DRAFT_44951 [Pyronema omphalodes]